MTIIDINGNEVQGLSEHIFRDKSAKTVCVSTALAYFGVTPDMYTVTSTRKNVTAYHGVLRRHGFGVRSRKSHTRKARSVGQLRKILPTVASKETENVLGYIVAVPAHLIVALRFRAIECRQLRRLHTLQRQDANRLQQRRSRTDRLDPNSPTKPSTQTKRRGLFYSRVLQPQIQGNHRVIRFYYS
jgi:hypothetical protein